MNVLVVAPHPDDEAIGCGGTICLRAARGDRVTAVFLTSGELGLKHLPREEAWRVREEEAQSAAKILALTEVKFLRCADWQLIESVDTAAALLQREIELEKPRRIYFPHPQDSHPDHQAAARILGIALKNGKINATELFAYEVWTPLSAYDHVEDISATMARKLRAVRSHRSQLSAFHYDRAVKGLNQYRGCLAGRCRFAEVFRQLHVNDLLEQSARGR